MNDEGAYTDMKVQKAQERWFANIWFYKQCSRIYYCIAFVYLKQRENRKLGLSTSSDVSLYNPKKSLDLTLPETYDKHCSLCYIWFK